MSDADRESPRDFAAAYALGALDADEARAFEALLETSPEARADLAEYREVVAMLALGAPEAGPSPELRARVLVSGQRQTASVIPITAARLRSPTIRVVPWLAAAAALALAVGFWRERDVLREQLAESTARLADREATLDAILEPQVTLYQLTSTGVNPPGIQLFVDRQRNLAIVHAFRLPPAPAGRVYQLWFIREGTPVPSVTFNSEADGHALVQRIAVPDGALSAAAITEEPAGGSQQPTTTPFLAGSIGRI